MPWGPKLPDVMYSPSRENSMALTHPVWEMRSFLKRLWATLSRSPKRFWRKDSRVFFPLSRCNRWTRVLGPQGFFIFYTKPLLTDQLLFMYILGKRFNFLGTLRDVRYASQNYSTKCTLQSSTLGTRVCFWLAVRQAYPIWVSEIAIFRLRNDKFHEILKSLKHSVKYLKMSLNCESIKRKLLLLTLIILTIILFHPLNV